MLGVEQGQITIKVTKELVEKSSFGVSSAHKYIGVGQWLQACDFWAPHGPKTYVVWLVLRFFCLFAFLNL